MSKSLHFDTPPCFYLDGEGAVRMAWMVGACGRGRWERTEVRDRDRIPQATTQTSHYDTPSQFLSCQNVLKEWVGGFFAANGCGWTVPGINNRIGW